MKIILTLFLTLSVFSSLAQENFGIKEKVDRLVSRKITDIYSKEIVSRIENYNALRANPREYFESVGIESSEIEAAFKIFPELTKNSLPELIIRKSGILVLRDRGNVVKFTFKSLASREVYINGVKIKTPKMTKYKFGQFFKDFSDNMYEGFNKKTTFMMFINSLSLIPSVHAQESDYLNLPDGEEVPHYHRKGYSPKDKIIDNLYSDEKFRHNVKQTSQVLLAGIMALAGDLELEQVANYENKKENLPANLKKLYKHIDKLANMCDEELAKPESKLFTENNDATKMITALDRINEKINRLDSMGKSWWNEVDRLVWRRTSFHFDADAKSYNICHVERIKKIYEDKNLCGNMEKISNCLIKYRSTGRVSEKTLTDDQMDLLLDHPLGRDHGQDDVLKWINTSKEK
ncbi:hypothetical protein [Halobacteriovorax sp. JY17]|uniref:hypothetical protein n=1 Tax=Halobacteriovorax sp. JY17 TaxID=2014617 RepID=UPI000C4AEE4F|nr:hypothetical protein [Halobacteriovorax sp. JY17]PIK15271.1 MAG: hypothetical protein CES88_00750 [Halobacteriovorax sp. JY17]